MAILLDSCYLFALNNEDDPSHDLVSKSYEKLLDGEFGIPIMLDYVFDELVTVIQIRTKRNDIATEIGNTILEDCNDYMQFSRVNKSIFDLAWMMFQNQSERKFLSFTDCTIICFAQEYKIKQVASLEKRFKSWVKTIP
ncbi:MAG: type II toxin-antitoxin system VapC family toxin [Candidatus Heimdallarchaeota archaeon]|nr:type II toxin-antitoxin system VapC family toxin [Candidatus Heimdallarchaeota archaeon]